MEKIEFQEVIKICTNFIQSPTEENATKLEELKSQLIIRAYMPMQDKVVSLYKVTIDADKSLDLASSVFTAGLELALLFDGLLAYTNIDINIPKEWKIYESYDAIYQSGLADYILQYCERDYNRLCQLMERTISYENLRELMNSMSAIQPEAIEAMLAEFKQFRESATPEMLHDMADIMRFNDPNLYHIKESVIDSAADQLERMDKAEKIELEDNSDK